MLHSAAESPTMETFYMKIAIEQPHANGPSASFTLQNHFDALKYEPPIYQLRNFADFPTLALRR